MDIFIDNRSHKDISSYEDIIYSVVNKTLENEKVDYVSEVSVSIVANPEIQVINKKFRNVDEATDVLSFPAHNKLLFSDQSKLKDVFIGDIIISIDRAEAQGEAYGHGVNREIGFLVSHGVLHLLGYDHENIDEENAMIAKQEDVLMSIGLKR